MKKILIIEDDQILRESVKDFLEEEGFEVYQASNGVDGVTVSLQQNLDCILCDIEMPKLRGYDVYKILQKSPKTQLVPVIFITAKVNPEDVRAGMQLGADDYLTKPFDFDELLTTINTRIEKRERLRNALNQSFNVFLANSLNGVFIISRRRIVYHNSRLNRMLHYTNEQLERMNYFNLIVQDDKKQLFDKIRLCLRGIQKNIRTDFRVITGKNTIQRIRMSAGMITFEGEMAFIGNIMPVEDNKTPNPNEPTPIHAPRATTQEQEPEKPQNPDNLTEREIEVLQMICKGFSSSEIAEKLFLSTRTIDRHRANLISKTNSRNTADLVVYAIRNGFVTV